MSKKKILGFGCLGLLLLIVAAGAAMWFFRPDVPITVDDPGEGGTRITINDRPANYFPGQGDGARPAILMLGGSEGGLTETSNSLARLLQAKGYSVLYPGYYRTSEATQSFDMVPVETFDQALEWLKSREDVDGNRIAVIGGSKGGEAALLIASRHPELKAVVSAMPSNVVWQGFDMSSMDMSKFQSSWSAGGKPLPYLPYTMLGFTEWFQEGAIGKMYSESLKKIDEHPDAIIRIEKTAAPVMLICGEKDNLWPSCDMARSIKARAAKFGQPQVQLLAYEDAGHGVFGTVRNPDDEGFEKLGSLGGSPQGNNEARKDNWPKVLAFLEKHLAKQN